MQVQADFHGWGREYSERELCLSCHETHIICFFLSSTSSSSSSERSKKPCGWFCLLIQKQKHRLESREELLLKQKHAGDFCSYIPVLPMHYVVLTSKSLSFCFLASNSMMPKCHFNLYVAPTSLQEWMKFVRLGTSNFIVSIYNWTRNVVWEGSNEPWHKLYSASPIN